MNRNYREAFDLISSRTYLDNVEKYFLSLFFYKRLCIDFFWVELPDVHCIRHIVTSVEAIELKDIFHPKNITPSFVFSYLEGVCVELLSILLQENAGKAVTYQNGFVRKKISIDSGKPIDLTQFKCVDDALNQCLVGTLSLVNTGRDTTFQTVADRLNTTGKFDVQSLESYMAMIDKNALFDSVYQLYAAENGVGNGVLSQCQASVIHQYFDGSMTQWLENLCCKIYQALSNIPFQDFLDVFYLRALSKIKEDERNAIRCRKEDEIRNAFVTKIINPIQKPFLMRLGSLGQSTQVPELKAMLERIEADYGEIETRACLEYHALHLRLSKESTSWLFENYAPLTYKTLEERNLL